MVGLRQSHAFHTDTTRQGQQLTPSERERLLKPYLPPEPNPPRHSNRYNSKSNGTFHHRQRVRPAMRHLIHSLLFSIIHIIFSVVIRIRQIYHALLDRVFAVLYYHHRTPELIRRDVRSLSRVPKHLSVILDLPPEGGKKDGLETLLNDACELAAWSASAGIPMLSIYERTGGQIYPRCILTLADVWKRDLEIVSATPSQTHNPHDDILLRSNIAIQAYHFPTFAEPPFLQPTTHARAYKWHTSRRQSTSSQNPASRRYRWPTDDRGSHKDPG